MEAWCSANWYTFECVCIYDVLYCMHCDILRGRELVSWSFWGVSAENEDRRQFCLFSFLATGQHNSDRQAANKTTNSKLLACCLTVKITKTQSPSPPFQSPWEISLSGFQLGSNPYPADYGFRSFLMDAILVLYVRMCVRDNQQVGVQFNSLNAWRGGEETPTLTL